MTQRDFTEEAEALFKRFADRHGLQYDVEPDAPIEVCWKFPSQPNLMLPIVLGLQNSDELNFGVSDFWSYFCPSPDVEEEFVGIIDAWVKGDARIGKIGSRSRRRLLQVQKDGLWETVYNANWSFMSFQRKPRDFICNIGE